MRNPMQNVIGLGVLAVSLVLTASARSQVQPPGGDEPLQGSLGQAIDQGTRLFKDKKDHVGCYWFCRGVLVALRPNLASKLELLKEIDECLESAEKEPDQGNRALAVLGMLTRIHLGLQSRVVAIIYKDTPITREELGEYLIDRMGADRLEALVNRRIIDKACKDHGIVVTEADINAQIADDLKMLGGKNITEKEFVDSILKRFNKTLFEWKEDIIRPRLAMAELARRTITIGEEDIRQAFEVKHGAKVQCRLIVLSMRDQGKWSEIYEEVKANEEAFARYAVSKYQFLDTLRESAGKVPSIHKHFGDANIEKAAFALKAGEVAPPIEMPDGTAVILKCDGHISADGVKLETVRASLEKSALDEKVSKKIPELVAQLRREAAPIIFLQKRSSERGAK